MPDPANDPARNAVLDDRERRADGIRRSAISVFAAQGFKGASMADLADAAGVSRPALYQYFDNRADLFRSAFQALLEDGTDAALAALDQEGTVADRLDGYLQRLKADGYEALSTTPHGDELMEAKHEFAADVAEAAYARARRGLRDFVEANTTVDPRVRDSAIDMLILSPAGLYSDHPPLVVYRERLTALARAVAALLAAD